MSSEPSNGRDREEIVGKGEVSAEVLLSGHCVHKLTNGNIHLHLRELHNKETCEAVTIIETPPMYFGFFSSFNGWNCYLLLFDPLFYKG
ncbi:uncharacterized protein [Gossypium hirsutum]|uniref:Uncharacterized protein isoform X4 n=1 Tax=Gossypium hirsutum TaxID=3635 RepID=A0A1U8P003_GOSHI|nr:uncharacterized protein LOC107953673 isoform X4 [Gossypium hirsutum]